jgi:hypothetical protein
MAAASLFSPPSRAEAFAALAAVLQPGLRGQPFSGSAALPLRAGLVVWDPSAPVSGVPSARTLPSPAAFRRTLADLIPEVPCGGVLSSPTLSPPTPAEAHAVSEPKIEAVLAFAPGDEQPLGSVATWVRVTEELAEDVNGLAVWLDRYLEWLVRLGEEAAILTGDGVTPNVQGFFAHPEVPDYSGTGDAVSDVVAEMVGQAAATGGLMPDTIVLPPADWAVCLVDGLADADGARLYGCDVVPSGALAPGQALVGACQVAAVLGRSGAVQVESTTSHDVDFTTNVRAIRAASRLALAVLQPSAFVRKTA